MAASSITIKKQYDIVVGKLESMATDIALLDQRPDDAIFIDDMLLRLKLWSADIQYDQGSLEWAENLVQVSIPLRERLQQLDQQCLLFDAISKQVSAEGQDPHTSEDPAKNGHEVSSNARDAAKRSLRLSVDDLVAFATPIKIAASVPKAARTEEIVSQVNQEVEKAFQPRPSKQFPYIMLGKPLPAYLVELLLGAVIIPEELLETGVGSEKPPSVRIHRYTAKVRVAQSTMETFSIGTQTVRSNSFLLGTSTSPALFGTTAVKVWQLVKPEEYFEFFIQKHRDDLEKLVADAPKANFVLVSVLLTAQLSGKQDLILPTGTVEHAKSESEQIFAFGCLEISDSLFGRPKISREPGKLRPTYHLPPNFNLSPPPVGPLALGSIVIDLRRVDPINADSRLEIPTDQLYRHYTSGFQSTRSRMGTGSHGIWAKFLSITGLGDEAGLLSQRAEDDTYKFDRLETIYFVPTEDYIRHSVEQSKVQDYIIASGYKPVYLVTGLKIARGAALIQARQTRIGHEAQVELGLPASIGAMTTRLDGNTRTTVFEGSNDFIFGIRFKKIAYRRQFLSGKRNLVEENFNKDDTQDKLLLCFGFSDVRIFRWTNLEEAKTLSINRALIEDQQTSHGDRPGPFRLDSINWALSADDIDNSVDKTFLTPDGSMLLVQTSQVCDHHRRRKQFMVLRMSALSADNPAQEITASPLPDHIRTRIEIPLGFLGSHGVKGIGVFSPGHPEAAVLAFLDKDFWVCTGLLSGDGEVAIKRYFFLQRDWLNIESLELAAVSEDGIFMCPRNGEIGVVTGGLKDEWIE